MQVRAVPSVPSPPTRRPLRASGWIGLQRAIRSMLAIALVASAVFIAPMGATPAVAAGTTHYVAPNGTATWSASTDSAAPCSLSTALANYAAGDIVVLKGGTYGGRPTFSRSGASGSPVTFRPAPAEKVVLSEGFVVSGSYLVFDGGGGRLSPASLGFVVTPGSATITTGYAPPMGQIAINGSNNTVSGFWVHTCARGAGVSFSDSATITGNTISNFVIGRPDLFDGLNIQHDGVNIGRNVSGTTIRDFEITGFGGSAGITSNQMCFGTGKGVLIENGYIHGPAGWYMGNNISDGDGVRFCGPDMTMRQVVVDIWQEYDHDGTGVKHSDAIMAYTGSSAAQGPDNLLIENCRFGSLNTTHSWDGGHSLGLGCSSNNSDNRTRSYTIRNSIWLMAEPADATTHGVWSYSGGSGLTIYFDNCYFKGGSPSLPSRVVYKNCVIAWPNNRSLEYGGRDFSGSSNNVFVGYSSLPTWAKGQPGSFVTSNPGLVNADFSAATRYGLDANLRPAAGSPLIDAGAAASTSPATDLDGNVRNAPIDIGPYEYAGSVPPPSDTTAPTVALTAPASGATVSGSVALAANAADNVGVSKVEFRVDGVLVGTDTSAPYAATWDASAAAAGAHTIQARAYDAANNTTNASVSVTVPAAADTTPPTVSFSQPAQGATVTGWVNPVAVASDNVGVSKVEFRVDGVLAETDTAAPYGFMWNAATASTGAHTIQARAYDAANNTADAAVTVTVPAPADTTAPVTTATPGSTPSSSGWFRAAPAVTLVANETATVEYQWDAAIAGAWSTYTATPVTAPEGVHTLYYRSIDTAGNVEGTKTLTLKVDTGVPTAPSITSSTHPDPNLAGESDTVSAEYSAQDTVSGVDAFSYAFDRAATTLPDTVAETGATSALFTPSEEGVWYVHVRARDAAGHWGPTAHRKVTVDLPAPAAPAVSSSVGDATVGLAWTSASDAAATRVLRSQNGFASGADDTSQTVVYEGADTSFTDTGLVNGTTYYYTLFQRNVVGEWGPGTQVSAAPKIPTALTLSTPVSTVTVNKSVTLTGQYGEGGVTAKAPGAVTVWSNATGSWSQIGSAYYSATSKSYTYKTRVTKSTTYQLRTSGDALRAAAQSNTKSITAKSSVSMRSTSTAVTYGTAASVSAAVNAPAPKNVRIYKYKYSPKLKRYVYKGKLKPSVKVLSSTYGTGKTKVKGLTKGRWKLVARHTVGGKVTYSNTVYVRVR